MKKTKKNAAVCHFCLCSGPYEKSYRCANKLKAIYYNNNYSQIIIHKKYVIY